MSKYEKSNPGQKPKDEAYEDFKRTLHKLLDTLREPHVFPKAERPKAPPTCK
jgi:hypothetical protein